MCAISEDNITKYSRTKPRGLYKQLIELDRAEILNNIFWLLNPKIVSTIKKIITFIKIP